MEIRPDSNPERPDSYATEVSWWILQRGSCGFEVTTPHGQQRCSSIFDRERECSVCGMLLWVTPLAKRLRLYDLRHTSATLHRMAGCDPLVIQELLGHASNLTDGTYTHLDDAYRRAELNKLKLEP